MRRVIQATVMAVVLSGAVAVVAQTSTPVPRPFPGAGAPRTGAPPPATPPPDTPGQPATPAAAPTRPAGPNLGNIPIYPSAEFLESIDAGSGQVYHLYGTNLSYAETVGYYRTVLKNGGREIYRSPGMHQFELGRFQEDRMAYPPSVVVKDYTGPDSKGYLFVSGTEEKRFATVIQIVPPGTQ